MPDAIKLDPKKTAFIIIDMVNAIAKGGPGPDYTLCLLYTSPSPRDRG